jgi:integrase
MESSEILLLPFRQGLEAWLEGYQIHISTKTFRDYAWDVRALASSYPQHPFVDRRLGEVKADHMHQYQRKRLLEDKLARVSVNHELDFLARVRKQLAAPVSGYKRLKVPFVIKGRALSEEERVKIVSLAEGNPHWMGAYLYLMLSLNFGAGPKECFTIHLGDIHLEVPDIPFGYVEVGGQGRGQLGPDGAKNEFRPRRCALNRESRKAVEMALERARTLGARDPVDFLFPFRISASDGYDPKRHMTSIKTAWKSLRKAAGLPNLRQYDMRHHCVTAMLENPEIADQVVEDTVGHIDPRTKRYYSHIRLKARAAAAALLCGDRPATETKPSPSAGNRTIEEGLKKPSSSVRAISTTRQLEQQLLELQGKYLALLEKKG